MRPTKDSATHYPSEMMKSDKLLKLLSCLSSCCTLQHERWTFLRSALFRGPRPDAPMQQLVFRSDVGGASVVARTSRDSVKTNSRSNRVGDSNVLFRDCRMQPSIFGSCSSTSLCTDATVFAMDPRNMLDLKIKRASIGRALIFRSGCGSEHAPFNGRLCVELAVCERGFLDLYALDRNENNTQCASTSILAIVCHRTRPTMNIDATVRHDHIAEGRISGQFNLVYVKLRLMRVDR